MRIAYVERRYAFVVGVSSIVLGRLEQLLHAGYVTDPGELHDVGLG